MDSEREEFGWMVCSHDVWNIRCNLHTSENLYKVFLAFVSHLPKLYVRHCPYERDPLEMRTYISTKK